MRGGGGVSIYIYICINIYIYIYIYIYLCTIYHMIATPYGVSEFEVRVC